MSGFRSSYRKQGDSHLWIQKFLKQLLVAICILLLIILIKKLNIAVVNETVETLHYQMAKDYSPQDLEETAKAVFSYTKEMPANITEAIRESENKMAFVPPADGAKTVAVFHSGGGSFTSEEEIQVYAAAGGTVTEIREDAAEGAVIYISHGNDRSTVYKGCGDVYVKPLERVKKGQMIGSVGIGEKLDFELWINKEKVNPAEYIGSL